MTNVIDSKEDWDDGWVLDDPEPICEDSIDVDEVIQSVSKSYKPYIEIVDTVENTDGTVTVVMDMDMDTLKRFASQAILKALIDAAENVVG